MPRQRYEISIAYKDKRGQTRYANKLGNLWLDTGTGKGNIELPPGVSIHNVEGAYLNVGLPYEGERGGGQRGGGSGGDDDGNY